MFNCLAHIEELKSEILDRNLIMITTDPTGVITDVSKGFELLSGYAKVELVGLTHKIISHPDTPREIFTHLWETITKGKQWYGEIKNKNKHGFGYWSKICIEPLLNEDNILGYIGIYTNITEQKELSRKVEIDPLTGIYNRSKLHLLLIHKIEQAYFENSTFPILFIDLDLFKSVNDQYGHLEGDRILVEFSNLIRNSLRSRDLFCRWGGEEFIIILDQTDIKTAYLIAEKLRNLVQEYDFGLDRPITLSIGISEYDSKDSIDDTIMAADQAMYKAKNQGRNQTLIAHENRE
ncbi:diguanylate cyclase [Sulfuricurvum sp.]|uniref:GGDEF domain-containing protein n=1 Tax=Sulfuricurvum sp. TaxID=2025608 RepID=UPI00261FE645|nr:diguanylate cyclase [Sulfuricurvum sp.]MDD2780204.1 diguanylate cyclase [Sulfuricurvum sp.]